MPILRNFSISFNLRISKRIEINSPKNAIMFLFGWFPLSLSDFHARMGDYQMPDDTLNASVWGVMVSGFTTGITTHASATLAVYPPSLPTIPNILALTLWAYSSALTRFTLTFFSWLPPPTDKTKTPSLALRLLPFNQAANDDSHPSSFIRAVSSETLSVGNKIRYQQFSGNHLRRGLHFRHYPRHRGRRGGLSFHGYPLKYLRFFQRTDGLFCP